MLLSFACSAHAATILVLGDSLSAGYGLEAGHVWVDLLAKRLQHHQPPYAVVNASISGETSAGGLARVDADLDRAHPAIVLLELGANDGLRGLSLADMRRNLDEIVTRARKRGAKVVLIGMRLPVPYLPPVQPVLTSQQSTPVSAIRFLSKLP